MYCFIFEKCTPTENTKGNQTIRVHFFVTSFYSVSATGASSSDFSAIEAKRRPVYLPSAPLRRRCGNRGQSEAGPARWPFWPLERSGVNAGKHMPASEGRKDLKREKHAHSLLACFSFLPLKEGRSRSSTLSSFNSRHLKKIKWGLCGIR